MAHPFAVPHKSNQISWSISQQAQILLKRIATSSRTVVCRISVSQTDKLRSTRRCYDRKEGWSMEISDKINSIWADCELVGVLGNGNFGTVYHIKIRDRYGNHSYAVKRIKFPSNELEARRFKRKEYKQKYYRQMIESYRDEVDTMMKLKNYDNVVQIIDYAIVEESLGYSIFIRMELLTPLNQKLKSGNISENEIIKLGIDLCTGLEVCKNIGIIHGDIKYDNILVSSSGKYKLSDFGVCLKVSCEHQYSIQNRGGANTSPPELVKKGIFNYKMILIN